MTDEHMQMPIASTLVAHDFLIVEGGGERVLADLLEIFQADLCVGFSNLSSEQNNFRHIKTTDLRLPKRLQNRATRVLSSAFLFSRKKRLAKKYERRIYSGIASIFMAPPRSQHARNIYYCHTPPRFLYDQKEYYNSQIGMLLWPIYALLTRIYAVLYRRQIRRMDVIIANSHNVQKRLKAYLGVDSQIICPAIRINDFHYRPTQNYYLSTARLSELKNVDKIVEAFKLLPEEKLIILSDGSEREYLEMLVDGAENIEFMGWVSDKELQGYLSNCTAVIYVPKDEDFGISPIEAMASGKPVIGVAQGGLLETLNAETGILLNPFFEVEDLRDAVFSLNKDVAVSMRLACEDRAQLFDIENFRARILDAVEGGVLAP